MDLWERIHPNPMLVLEKEKEKITIKIFLDQMCKKIILIIFDNNNDAHLVFSIQL